jgi:ATP-dependent protease Clp ATPase subunit
MVERLMLDVMFEAPKRAKSGSLQVSRAMVKDRVVGAEEIAGDLKIA